MKFSKIETQGITSLVFSLAALPEDPAALAKSSAKEELLGADTVLFLTPTLAADIALHSYRRTGERYLSHEVLHTLAAYLFYVAGLPVYAYEAETEDGIFPVKIIDGTPPTFSVKYGKCKQLLENKEIKIKNTEIVTDLFHIGDRVFSVLITDDAQAADLPAVAHAHLLSPAVRAETAVVLSPLSEGTPAAYRLRFSSLDGREPPSPSAAAGAALAALAARGRETYGREVVFHHEGGTLACRMDRGGTLTVRAAARLLLRGEWDPSFRTVRCARIPSI